MSFFNATGKQILEFHINKLHTIYLDPDDARDTKVIKILETYTNDQLVELIRKACHGN